MTSLSDRTYYEAAREGAALYRPDPTGYLRIAGRDQIDFLQRQTTNDLQLLKPGGMLLNVLTNPAARMLDVFYLLFEEPSDPESVQLPGLALLNLGNYAEETYRYLKSRIFFMDQVTLTDHSSDFTQLGLLGPGSARLLEELGADTLPETGQVIRIAFGDSSIRALGTNPALELGFRLLLPVVHDQALVDRLQALGATEIPPSVYHTLRVEAGLPAGGHELTAEYTPLESGLGSAVSGSKGCYTGQEVIARQITYDKITQSLCGVKLPVLLAEGSHLESDSRTVGRLTSVVDSPRFGPIALAVIKRPHDQPGTRLRIAEHQAEVCELPFH